MISKELGRILNDLISLESITQLGEAIIVICFFLLSLFGLILSIASESDINVIKSITDIIPEFVSKQKNDNYLYKPAIFVTCVGFVLLFVCSLLT